MQHSGQRPFSDAGDALRGLSGAVSCGSAITPTIELQRKAESRAVTTAMSVQEGARFAIRMKVHAQRPGGAGRRSLSLVACPSA